MTDEPYDDEDEDDDDDPVALAMDTSDSLDERYDLFTDDEAFEDADFVAAVAALRAAEATVLDRLSRDSRPYIAALALAAIVEGSWRPEGWVDRAVARVRKGGTAETRFVLGLLASPREPVLARVLAVVDETWAGASLAQALGEFIERRVAAGDTARGVEVGLRRARRARDPGRARRGRSGGARRRVGASAGLARAQTSTLTISPRSGGWSSSTRTRHRCSSARARPSSISSRLPSARSRHAP